MVEKNSALAKQNLFDQDQAYSLLKLSISVKKKVCGDSFHGRADWLAQVCVKGRCYQRCVFYSIYEVEFEAVGTSDDFLPDSSDESHIFHQLTFYHLVCI